MSKCSFIDPLMTPYVDGELPDAEREAVTRHVGACPPCQGRLVAERAVRERARRQTPRDVRRSRA